MCRVFHGVPSLLSIRRAETCSSETEGSYTSSKRNGPRSLSLSSMYPPAAAEVSVGPKYACLSSYHFSHNSEYSAPLLQYSQRCRCLQSCGDPTVSRLLHQVGIPRTSESISRKRAWNPGILVRVVPKRHPHTPTRPYARTDHALIVRLLLR